MLRGLLAAKGANASIVTVYIDGFFQEPKEVAELLGIRAIQVTYNMELLDSFTLHPDYYTGSHVYTTM